MKVVGTAGHVDHGKSTLVAALTGIDPDRLKEEKAREMTIESGFAWMDLPNGETIGFVDVPGHRDFVENMLAGVGGIDAVIFVIAADEGVMPQTREHLAILDLLAVKKGIIALTKSDLVSDQDWLTLIKADIEKAVNGTFLENAPIVPVSAKTGAGLNELLLCLEQCLDQIPQKKDIGKPRLSIDRVFSIQGFGTIVTGTLMDGTLSLGEEIVILPSGLEGRIRGLQTHKAKLEKAVPGSRVAVNISGLNVKDLKRGDLLTTPQKYKPSTRVDAHIRLLRDSNFSLKHNDMVKVFHLAAERMGRIRVLGKDNLAPGENGYVQIEFSELIVMDRNDRFILRYPSPGETIGGGVILQTDSLKRYKRFSEDVLQKLMSLDIGTTTERISETASGFQNFQINQIANLLSLSEDETSNEIEKLVEKGQILEFSQEENTRALRNYIVKNQWDSIVGKITTIISDYHNRYPLRPGVTKEELKSKSKLNNTLFNLLIGKAIKEKLLNENDGYFQLPNHKILFSPDQLARIENLNRQWDKSPYSPPGINQALEILGEELFNALITQHQFTRVSQDVAFRKREFDEMTAYVKSRVIGSGSLNVTEFRDHFNTSRKYVLAYLEYLDQIGFTIRNGDSRRLNDINKVPE